MNYRATVVTETTALREWNGRKVNIVRVIDNPEIPASGRSPLIKVLDDKGNRATFTPKEIRTEDLSEEYEPVVVDGLRIMNLHPVASAALLKVQRQDISALAS